MTLPESLCQLVQISDSAVLNIKDEILSHWKSVVKPLITSVGTGLQIEYFLTP